MKEMGTRAYHGVLARYVERKCQAMRIVRALGWEGRGGQVGELKEDVSQVEQRMHWEKEQELEECLRIQSEALGPLLLIRRSGLELVRGSIFSGNEHSAERELFERLRLWRLSIYHTRHPCQILSSCTREGSLSSLPL